MLTRFIGDVHGKFDQYKKIIKDVPRSIQVGDMGIGFKKTQGPRFGEEYSNPPHYAVIKGDHRFIRGNHDNPASCAKHSQFIKDGTVEGNMMFVGGALSVDKQFRIEGLTWWKDEELSYQSLQEMINLYIKTKPETMVTHECPESIACIIVGNLTGAWTDKLDFPSRTRTAFQHMFSAHSPKYWIFGHWHTKLNVEVNGTRFICLPELECIDLDV